MRDAAGAPKSAHKSRWGARSLARRPERIHEPRCFRHSWEWTCWVRPVKAKSNATRRTGRGRLQKLAAPERKSRLLEATSLYGPSRLEAGPNRLEGSGHSRRAVRDRSRRAVRDRSRRAVRDRSRRVVRGRSRLATRAPPLHQLRLDARSRLGARCRLDVLRRRSVPGKHPRSRRKHTSLRRRDCRRLRFSSSTRASTRPCSSQSCARRS
jgi:hypothetical protein